MTKIIIYGPAHVVRWLVAITLTDIDYLLYLNIKIGIVLPAWQQEKNHLPNIYI